MFAFIMPAFLTTLFTVQDMVVGSYPLSQRLIFGAVVAGSFVYGMYTLRSANKDDSK